jgi:hypothetical protein
VFPWHICDFYSRKWGTKRKIKTFGIFPLQFLPQNVNGGLKNLYNLREDLAMEEKYKQDFISKSSPVSCFLCAM